MSNPPPSPPTLQELRKEIDAIDEQVHRLLMARGDIIDRLIQVKKTQEVGSAFRPAREASMMRELVQRHRGILPLDTIEGIWRVIISTFTYVQAPFAVHADVSVGEQAMRDSARFHFGFVVPYVSHFSAQAAVEAAQGRVVVNLAPVVEVDRDSLLQADPLLANEHEAGLILDQLGLPAEGAPRELAHRLVEAGFRSVVLTLGAHGAYVATPEGGTDIPTPRVTAVDTTGAGDAFAGAFCAQLLTGASLVDAATFAARVGAFAATGNGAQPSYPTTESVLPEVTDA